jgi:ATP-dependent exoDNAse (exonuclease V) beta subunit
LSGWSNAEIGFANKLARQLQGTWGATLLYVACTRARDHLLVTGVRPASEFLGDLAG